MASRCSSCGGIIQGSVKFCKFCGSEIPPNKLPVQDLDLRFCESCGKTTPSDAKFCYSCGKGIPVASERSGGLPVPPPSPRAPVNQPLPHVVVSPPAPPVYYKNPGVATILSFFWMGAGQIYNGQIGKGILFIILYAISAMLMFLLIGFITTPILWIIGMIDANSAAKSINLQLAQTDRHGFRPYNPF